MIDAAIGPRHAVDHHEPIRIGERQRLQEHRIDGAENRGRRADAERERQDGGKRECRILAQRFARRSRGPATAASTNGSRARSR